MPEFVDVQKMHAENPHTFKVPSHEELMDIEEDDFVRVCAGKERFWVRVTGIEEDNLIGRVCGDLIYTDLHGLNWSDEVMFSRDNVYNIQR